MWRWERYQHFISFLLLFKEVLLFFFKSLLFKKLFIDSLWTLHHAHLPTPTKENTKIKVKIKINKNKTKHNRVVKAVVCHSVSHNIFLCPHIFTCKCSLQWVIALVQGLWILLHDQSWIFPGFAFRILLLSYVVEVPSFWICRTGPFMWTSTS